MNISLDRLRLEACQHDSDGRLAQADQALLLAIFLGFSEIHRRRAAKQKAQVSGNVDREIGADEDVKHLILELLALWRRRVLCYGTESLPPSSLLPTAADVETPSLGGRGSSPCDAERLPGQSSGAWFISQVYSDGALELLATSDHFSFPLSHPDPEELGAVSFFREKASARDSTMPPPTSSLPSIPSSAPVALTEASVPIAQSYGAVEENAQCNDNTEYASFAWGAYFLVGSCFLWLLSRTLARCV